MREVKPSCPAKHLAEGPPENAIISISPPSHPASCILVGSIRDYFGDVVAVVEINATRLSIVGRLSKTRNLMIFVGVARDSHLFWPDMGGLPYSSSGP